MVSTTLPLCLLSFRPLLYFLFMFCASDTPVITQDLLFSTSPFPTRFSKLSPKSTTAANNHQDCFGEAWKERLLANL